MHYKNKTIFYMKSFSLSTILGLTLGVLLAGYAVFAFTPPTVAPTGGNTLAPINTGSSDQTKSGGLLNVFGLWVNQSLGVSGGATFGGDVSWVGNLTSGSVPWGRLTSVPAGLSDGDQVGITSESDPTVAASVKDGVSWDEVSGKPALGLKLHAYATGSSISTGNCAGSFFPAKCRADAVTLQTTIATTGQYLIIAGINLFQTGTTINTLMHLNIDGSNIGTMSYVHGSSDTAKSTTVIRTLSAGSRTLKINYSCVSSNGCTIKHTSITVLGPL